MKRTALGPTAACGGQERRRGSGGGKSPVIGNGAEFNGACRSSRPKHQRKSKSPGLPQAPTKRRAERLVAVSGRRQSDGGLLADLREIRLVAVNVGQLVIGELEHADGSSGLRAG